MPRRPHRHQHNPAPPSTSPEPPEPKFGLHPRTHNIVSYTWAIFVFLVSTPSPTFPPPLSTANILWLLHFARRAVESKYFRFSKSVIRPADTVQELAYYGFFAWWIARATYARDDDRVVSYVLNGGLWALCEAMNCYLHIQLIKNHRRKKHNLPPDWNFRVSHPHYFFEMCSWLFFWDVTGHAWPAFVFFCVGCIIMNAWAWQKFDTYPVEYKKTHAPIIRMGWVGEWVGFHPENLRPPKGLMELLQR